ncbi:SWAP/Surp [Arabidopsis suecica]|uniref:SWAP/Surp n=1 Tax=Arabidopsis suecica TaxID=45249 RepID=A0A8T2CAZ3_ARASU|nr:SWAP/Surp [Arabidopsis suecica]
MSNDLQSGQNNNPNLSPADVPPWVRYLADSSARLVFKYGVEMESSMMTSYARNPDYSFFRSSDRYHAYYQKKLAEYRAQKHEGPEIKYSDYGIADTPLRVKVREPFRKPPEFPAYLPESFSDKKPPMKRPPPPPRKYAAILPKWITGKELETIKATAKSVAQHGQVLNLVKEGNMDEPQYQFMIPGDWRYLYFNNLVDAYRHDNLRSAELVASESEVAAYEESFQRFFEEKKKLHEGAELAVIDSHEFVWMLLLKPPDESEGSEPKRKKCFEESKGAEPKRQRCFDESALAPDDQFLAQHLASSQTFSGFVYNDCFYPRH